MAPLPHMQGRWRKIDDEARRRDRVLVRSGANYAAAYWSGAWFYANTAEMLDFKPKEYRA